MDIQPSSSQKKIFYFEARYPLSEISAKKIFDHLMNKFEVLQVDLRADYDEDDPEKDSGVLKDFRTNLGEDRLEIEKNENQNSFVVDFLKELGKENSIHKLEFDEKKSKYTLNWIIQNDMMKQTESEFNSGLFKQIDLILKYLNDPLSLSKDEVAILKDQEPESDEELENFQRNRNKIPDESESDEDEDVIKPKKPFHKKESKEKKAICSKSAVIQVITTQEGISHFQEEQGGIQLSSRKLKGHKKDIERAELFYNLKFMQFKDSKYDRKVIEKSESQKLFNFDRLAFGIFNPQAENPEFLEYWDADNKIETRQFLYGVENLKLKDKAQILLNPYDFRWMITIDINMNNIKEILLEWDEEKQNTHKVLYISFHTPPTFSVSKLGKVNYTNPKYSKVQWERVPNFAIYKDTEMGTFLKTYVEQQTVLRIKLKVTKLNKKPMVIGETLISQLREKFGPHKFKCVQKVQFSKLESIQHLVVHRTQELTEFSFEIRYAILSCISQSKIDLFKFSKEFLDYLKKLDKTVILKTFQDIATRSLRFEKQEVKISNLDFKSFFDELYEKNLATKELWDNIQPPKNMVKIRKIILTPSSTQFLIPRYEFMNAITHRYADFAESMFLRVDVTDDTGLSAKRMNYVSDRIFFPKMKRLFLLNKMYQFLAYSASQLRSSSFWMIENDPKKIKLENFYKEIGDLSLIGFPAKYGARLGQLFSAFESTLDLEKINIVKIKDIEQKVLDGKNVITYNFSDGIGKISLNLLGKIEHQMRCFNISAIQIRFAGVKGILVGDPELPDNTIHIRPSMIKYEDSSYDKYLYILNHTKYIKPRLNRQIIMLLETLGVSKDVFMELQRANCEEIFNTATNQAEFRDSEYLQSTILPIRSLLKKSIENGVNFVREPFLKGILDCIKSSSLEQLKERASIIVNNSALVMGVLDEYGILDYGEVYIAITNKSNDDEIYYVESQEVIVTKNPCLHPGDIRVLCARADKEVKERFGHLVNCIVFPSKGKRPHTSEISGSDLDGDMYFVSWDKKLIPEEKNFPPMKYDTIKPRAIIKNVKIEEHVVRFFFEFINNDQLGKIDNSHLALADNSPSLVKDSKCLDLAKLHAVAVDYPKSGIPAALVKRDFQLGLAKKYPDYMEKEPEISYTSDKALGLLYRDIKKIMEDYEKENPEKPMNYVFIHHDFVYPGYQKYLKEAFKVLKEYYVKIEKIMDNCQTTSEFDIYLSGLRTSKFKDRISSLNLAKMTIDKQIEMDLLKDHLNSIFVKNMDKCEDEDVYAKASAWYIATYYNKNCKIQEISDFVYQECKAEYYSVKDFIDLWNLQLLGMPWFIVPEILLDVKQYNRKKRFQEAKAKNENQPL